MLIQTPFDALLLTAASIRMKLPIAVRESFHQPHFFQQYRLIYLENHRAQTKSIEQSLVMLAEMQR